MYFTVVVPDCYSTTCPVRPVLSNQRLLEISVALFALLLLSEVVGAEISNSLSLAGDAASMSIDILTYLCNMYGEWIRSNRPSSYSCSSSRWVSSKLLLDVVIPCLSASGLLVVTMWVAFDAVRILRHPPPSNTVDTSYLYGFATVNLGVDLICGYLFYLRSGSIFVEAPVFV
jgi:Co/Zn/Cd efflux system component